MTAAAAIRRAAAGQPWWSETTPAQRRALVRVVRHQRPHRLTGLAIEIGGRGTILAAFVAPSLLVGIEPDGYAHS